MAKMTSQTIAFMTILTLTAAVQAGSVLYVDDDASPNGDGTSWKTAFRFLQDALTEAGNGGIVELRIAQGLYRPDQSELNPEGTIDQHATFDLVQDVALVGGYAGIGAPDPDERDIDLYETILTGLLVPVTQCDFPSDCCNAHKTPGCDCGSCESIVCAFIPNCCMFEWDEFCAEAAAVFCDHLCPEPTIDSSFHVVTVFQTIATLDGLTISDGVANWPLHEEERTGGGVLNIAGDLTVIDCLFINNYAGNGGSIYNLESSATIQGCEFINNLADFGGAIYNLGGDIDITDCMFVDNEGDARGGGIYNNASDAIITNCQFIGNFCRGDGGGGMYNENCSPTIIGSTFEQNIVNIFLGGNGGGGILNKASSPFVLDCNFIGNSAIDLEDFNNTSGGGGISNRDDSNPIIVNCTFIDNMAIGNEQLFRCAGGALSSIGSNPIVIECTFLNNEAELWGGGIATAKGTAIIVGCEFIENTGGQGGAIMSYQADSSTIAQCNFLRNHAYWGGAVAEYSNSSSAFANCTFYENSALGGGAAASWNGARPTFTNCIFTGNLAEDLDGFAGLGGALASLSSLTAPSNDMELVNCTISTNFASISGGGVFVGRPYNGQGDIASATITNSIIWNNLDQNGNGESAQVFIDQSAPDFSASVNYSTIEGLTGSLGGIGNIGSDPLFVDPDGADDIPGNEDDNLRLQPGSPAIDAAFNNAVPFDLADLDEDDDTNEFTPVDLDGNPRFADAPKSPDTGCGVPVIVDMGAYEFLGYPIQPCLGDTTGDLIVNTSDLLVLFSTWGTCDGCCLADFDTNGLVNTSDLLILFANWGLCK
ncbi:MAG: hypothetical protein IH984_15800 [Planctomycetes bacterium]|nr:hypothetical protein [Planctomycetota bacterium]